MFIIIYTCMFVRICKRMFKVTISQVFRFVNYKLSVESITLEGNIEKQIQLKETDLSSGYESYTNDYNSSLNLIN